jgi:beta-phosphoglucomutase-like phosphatase (HAD superfamily)
MTLVKAVFLDIDGTLMDTNYLHIEAWAQAFEEVGARPPRSRIHHQVGKGSDRLIPEFVEDGHKAARVSELHSEYYAQLQERGHPLPGAKELVTSLVDRGYEVWFATSAKPEELEHHMKELGAKDNSQSPPPTSSGSPWSGRGSLPRTLWWSVTRSGTSRPPRRPG